MHRSIRLAAALLAAIALLFSQLAISAHACASAMQAAAPSDMTSDKDDPNLCERHCAGVQASFEMAKPAPTIIAQVAAPEFSVPVAFSPVEAVSAVSLTDFVELRPPPPAFAQRSCVLRI